MPLGDRIAGVNIIRRFCKLISTPIPRGYSWSPADLGQARMAGLGWMMSLADKEQPSKLNELIDRTRTAAVRKPVDLRTAGIGSTYA